MNGRNSPLRVELNPWTLDHTLHDVMQLRGAFVAALGTIETILTEAAIRISKMECYTQIRPAFPTRRPDRIRYLQAICNSAGPLHRYRPLVTAVIVRFEWALEMRDMLAHGRMQVLSGPGSSATISFQDYYGQGGVIILREKVYILEELRAHVHSLTRTSRAVNWLYRVARHSG